MEIPPSWHETNSPVRANEGGVTPTLSHIKASIFFSPILMFEIECAKFVISNSPTIEGSEQKMVFFRSVPLPPRCLCE